MVDEKPTQRQVDKTVSELQENQTLVNFEVIKDVLEKLFPHEYLEGRIKSKERILEKERCLGIKRDKMIDILGFRMIMEEHYQEEVAQKVHAFKVKKHQLKDGYYSATHYYCVLNGIEFELQIRTMDQDRIAKAVEYLDYVWDTDVKYRQDDKSLGLISFLKSKATGKNIDKPALPKSAPTHIQSKNIYFGQRWLPSIYNYNNL